MLNFIKLRMSGEELNESVMFNGFEDGFIYNFEAIVNKELYRVIGELIESLDNIILGSCKHFKLISKLDNDDKLANAIFRDVVNRLTVFKQNKSKMVIKHRVYKYKLYEVDGEYEVKIT